MDGLGEIFKLDVEYDTVKIPSTEYELKLRMPVQTEIEEILEEYKVGMKGTPSDHGLMCIILMRLWDDDIMTSASLEEAQNITKRIQGTDVRTITDWFFKFTRLGETTKTLSDFRSQTGTEQ